MENKISKNTKANALVDAGKLDNLLSQMDKIELSDLRNRVLSNKLGDSITDQLFSKVLANHRLTLLLNSIDYYLSIECQQNQKQN